jgi:enoyl-[acyl-carrier protein] reductase II
MQKFDTLWSRGVEFLGNKYPIMGGAMSWVSESNLVSAISNAGGFGVLACGSMTPEMLEAEIIKTRERTFKNFGVNLILMHPNFDDLVAVCIRQKVTHVVLAAGLTKQKTIDFLKEHNIKTLSFAPSLTIAKKLIANGIDAIIIEGSEAGGHIGNVSTAVLAQEILPFVTEVPVFIAGGIGCGAMIAAFMKMGASGCQLGTRFVCAKESIAHANFKKLYIRSSARHAVTSIQLDENFTVTPVRAIYNKGVKEFMEIQKNIINEYKNSLLTKEEAQLKIEHYWAGALRKAVIDGDVEYGSVMAGQSVGLVSKEQMVAEIIAELVDEVNKSRADI